MVGPQPGFGLFLQILWALVVESGESGSLEGFWVRILGIDMVLSVEMTLTGNAKSFLT